MGLCIDYDNSWGIPINHVVESKQLYALRGLGRSLVVSFRGCYRNCGGQSDLLQDGWGLEKAATLGDSLGCLKWMIFWPTLEVIKYDIPPWAKNDSIQDKSFDIPGFCGVDFRVQK